MDAVGFVWRGHAFHIAALVAVGIALAITFYMITLITDRVT